MKTKVFISWSGEHSRQVALALRKYLPRVIPGIDPWMSGADIDKGERWNEEIAKQLDESTVGILCIVPDNRKKPWLLFEAGALAKSVGDILRVCPFLHHLKPTDIEPPLGGFQATVAQKDDVHKLLKTLNSCCGELTSEAADLDAQFEMWWPKLETELGAIELPAGESTDEPVRTESEKIDEILGLLRGIKWPRQSSSHVLTDTDRLIYALNKFAEKSDAHMKMADVIGALESQPSLVDALSRQRRAVEGTDPTK